MYSILFNIKNLYVNWTLAFIVQADNVNHAVTLYYYMSFILDLVYTCTQVQHEYKVFRLSLK